MTEEETIGFGDEFPPPPADLPEDSLASYNPEHSHFIPLIGSPTPRPHHAEFPTESIQLSRWSISAAQDPDETHVPAQSGPLPIPTTSGPAFRMLRMVGRGGFGEVWESIQVSLDRVVAVKRLRIDLQERQGEAPASGGELERNFHQEALTTANLDHPNIVPVHDIGVDADGSPLLAMKFVRGKPWNELIAEEMAELSVVDFLAKHIPILVDVCQAVAFAHSRGVIHRDLKPSQVMVGEFGEVMLMDWGLAVVFDKDALTSATQANMQDSKMNFLPTPHSASNPAGTLSFMAPEQTAPNAQHIGPWTDVYLLGGTLYYLLTGKPPHTGSESREVFLKARMGDVPAPSDAADGREVPPELEDLCMRALEASYEERMQSAKEFLTSLQDYLSGASKRRDSLVITEYVAHSLTKDGHDYHKYSDALAELSRASALWGENPDIAPLREKTQQQYARVALENDDLVLAKLLVESMGESPVQLGLATELTTAEARSRRREHQRRTLFLAVGILMIVILAGGVAFNVHIMKQHEVTRQERDRARLARNDATVLVNFMLNDLKDSLEPIGQLDPLLRVSDKVVGYYKKFPREDMTPDAEAQLGTALLSVAMLQLNAGNTTAALDTLLEYHKVGRRLALETSTRQQWWRRLVQGYILSSRIHALQGNMYEAQKMIGEAIAVAARYASLEGAFAERAIPTESEIRQLLSGEQGANLREALEIVDALAEWNQEDVSWRADVAMAYEKVGELLEAERDYYMAQRAHEKSLALRTSAIERDSANLVWQQAVIDSYLSLSRSASGQVLTREARQFAEAALDRAGQLSREHPQHLEFLGSIAASRAQIASVLDAGGRLEDAAEQQALSIESAQALARIDENNASWQHGLALRQAEMGALQKRLGRMGESISNHAQAIAVLRRLVVQDPQNSRWREDLIRALSGKLDVAASRQASEPAVAATLAGEVLDIALSAAESAPTAEPYRNVAVQAAAMGILAARTAERTDQAQQMAERARSIIRKGSSEADAAEVPTSLADFHFAAALLAIDTGAHDVAFELLDESAAAGFANRDLLEQYRTELDSLRPHNPERHTRTIRALEASIQSARSRAMAPPAETTEGT